MYLICPASYDYESMKIGCIVTSHIKRFSLKLLWAELEATELALLKLIK